MREGLAQLEQALLDYYGGLQEIAMTQTLKVPEKPEALVLYQRVQALGIPPVEGGIEDQPHIWMQELAVVRDTEELFSNIQPPE